MGLVQDQGSHSVEIVVSEVGLARAWAAPSVPIPLMESSTKGAGASQVGSSFHFDPRSRPVNSNESLPITQYQQSPADHGSAPPVLLAVCATELRRSR